LVAASVAAATAAESLGPAAECVAWVAVHPELTARAARAALRGYGPSAVVIGDILGAASATTRNKLDRRSQTDRAETTAPTSAISATVAAAIKATRGACPAYFDREYLARLQRS
jgi:hypothetical protein